MQSWDRLTNAVRAAVGAFEVAWSKEASSVSPQTEAAVLSTTKLTMPVPDLELTSLPDRACLTFSVEEFDLFGLPHEEQTIIKKAIGLLNECPLSQWEKADEGTWQISVGGEVVKFHTWGEWIESFTLTRRSIHIGDYELPHVAWDLVGKLHDQFEKALAAHKELVKCDGEAWCARLNDFRVDELEDKALVRFSSTNTDETVKFTGIYQRMSIAVERNLQKGAFGIAPTRYSGSVDYREHDVQVQLNLDPSIAEKVFSSIYESYGNLAFHDDRGRERLLSVTQLSFNNDWRIVTHVQPDGNEVIGTITRQKQTPFLIVSIVGGDSHMIHPSQLATDEFSLRRVGDKEIEKLREHYQVHYGNVQHLNIESPIIIFRDDKGIICQSFVPTDGTQYDERIM